MKRRACEPRIVTKNTAFPFKCLKCGKCCKEMDIYLDQDDMHRLIKRFGIETVRTIVKPGVKPTNDGSYLLPLYVLIPPCHFLTPENLCSIYAIRPYACRQFPLEEDFEATRWLECPGGLVPDAPLITMRQWEKRHNIRMTGKDFKRLKRAPQTVISIHEFIPLSEDEKRARIDESLRIQYGRFSLIEKK